MSKHPSLALFNPKLDLKIERVVDVPPALVWKAWTEPKHLMPWFCPKPWFVSECDIDLYPGGQFRTVMCGPDGEKFDSTGCFLTVEPQRLLAWTSALGPGYRPLPVEDLPMTALISIEPEGKGTRYTAIALHRDAEGREKHLAMGFEQGWSTALDQLVEYVKSL